MRKVLLSLVIIILLFGCDKRGIDKPLISVIADKTEIFDSQNDRTISLSYKLTGEKSYISHVKILLEYNSDLATFIGTGNAHYIFTDENGETDAIFQIKAGAIGTVELISRLDSFRTVNFSTKIIVHPCPQIESFVATPDTIQANGTSMSVLDLQLTASNKLDGIKVFFHTNYGYLSADSVYTDISGHIQISLVSESSPAQAIIQSVLEKCPTTTSSVTVWME